MTPYQLSRISGHFDKFKWRLSYSLQDTVDKHALLMTLPHLLQIWNLLRKHLADARLQPSSFQAATLCALLLWMLIHFMQSRSNQRHLTADRVHLCVCQTSSTVTNLENASLQRILSEVQLVFQLCRQIAQFSMSSLSVLSHLVNQLFTHSI